MDFYKEVENYFLQARGRYFGIHSYNLLSPSEIKAIKELENRGVAMKTITLGIDESLKRFRMNYPDRIEDPPGLLYCKPTILKHHRRITKAAVGKAPDKPTKKEPVTIPTHEKVSLIIGKSIKEVERSPLFRNKAEIIDIINNLATKYKEISSEEKPDEELWEKNLENFITEISCKLSWGIKKFVLMEISEMVGKYKTKMNRDTFIETRNAIYYEKILEILQLNELDNLA
ncbi:MAG: hypothetical protein JW737_00975 [Acidobacteria bacterium]|nr:hypothetical protein [Acidobacteriota bacterium]